MNDDRPPSAPPSWGVRLLRRSLRPAARGLRAVVRAIDPPPPPPPPQAPLLERLAWRARGRGVVLHDTMNIHRPEDVALGDWVFVGPHGYWNASGGITIGHNVSIGPEVKLMSAVHRVDGSEERIPFDTRDRKGEIVIEPHVWVGGWSIVLPGVTLGEGCVVGAGAVVARSVEPLMFVAGNPARPFRRRDPERFARLRDEGRWHVKMYVEEERPDLLA